MVGDTVRGRARLLEGEERRRRRALLRPAGPLFWTLVLYKLRGKIMNLYEVVPAEEGEGGTT